MSHLALHLNTKLSIIAVKFDEQYYSVRCYYDGKTNISDLLTSKQNSETSAIRFVSLGDVELSRKNGFLVLDRGNNSTNNKTQNHRSPLKLVTYALEQGSENLHTFENGEWQVMPLLSEELVIDGVV